MAIGAATVWRVRTGGNNANGGGYDSTISGAGTDYTQQDSPQLSLTDIACSSSTTVTSATGGFTSAMIGNAIRITGGGATSGWYFITAVGSSTSITVDRTPGAVTGGTGKVGGGLATFQSVIESTNATGNKCVAGNTIYIRGSGSDDPSSADYTFTGYTTPVSGDATNGFVRLVGENGRPRLLGNGLVFYNCVYNYFEGLYFHTNSNNFGYMGFIITADTIVIAKRCFFNMGNQATMAGITMGHASGLYDCEVYGGTTSPTFSSTSYGVKTDGYGCEIHNCRIHHCRDAGIYVAATARPAVVHQNNIYANAGDGIYFANYSAAGGLYKNNTIDNNLGNGINVAAGAAAAWNSIYNNIISNHTGSGKKALNFTAGTTAVNDRMKRLLDYNVFYNNTTNYGNVTAGANDSVVDPGYADSANGDFTPTNDALKGVVYPGSFGAVVNYQYPGATQPDAAGGGGGVVVPSSIYGAEGMRVFV